MPKEYVRFNINDYINDEKFEEIIEKTGAVKQKSGDFVIEKDVLNAFKNGKYQIVINNIETTYEPQTNAENSKDIRKEINKENDNFIWDEVLNQETSNLMLLLYLDKYGLPEDTNERTRLLALFNRKTNGNYPLSYEAVCQYNEEFATKYNPEVLTNLIKHSIFGQREYKEELMDSDLTNEEKAILLFALPLQ